MRLDMISRRPPIIFVKRFQYFCGGFLHKKSPGFSAFSTKYSSLCFEFTSTIRKLRIATMPF